MSFEPTFGQQIKARRRELGLTQDELARRVGCAPVTLRKIEYDDLRPSVQIAERLAMALNLPLEERAAFVRFAREERPQYVEPAPTPPPSPAEIGADDLSGRAIRGYALGERIGAGGMGAVYRATQPVVEREVAVKIILPEYANQPDFIRRFEAEAQLVARLEHPHIVPLYDYWREPSVAYLVMRLLRGGSVQNLLQAGPAPLDLAVRLLEQVALALGAAHRVGVVHRDLKPANVLLDEDLNAYLADFGIAKNWSNPAVSMTRTDAIVGSPAYISPEQIRSEFVRPQTDIYCLGVMMYELFTGVVPFSGPTPIEVMHQHLTAPLPPLVAHRAGLPGALDLVIERATAKDPNQRYENVDALLKDLRRAVPGGLPAEVPAEAATQIMARPLTAADNPYKGLRAFAEGDAPDFFGREALTQQLLVRLGEGGDLARFLAVVGPSGSGKSSVVKAGLLPALRRGALPGSEHWFIVEMLPGPRPLEDLEAALLRVAVNPPASLLEQIKSDKRGLLRAVRRCLPEEPAVELVLVIDQFEEVFTLCQDEAARAHFLDSLVTAVLDERSRLRVVLTLRADFTDRPLAYVDFGELMRHRLELALPLTPDELEQAILGPAQRLGLEVEPGLAADMARAVDDQPGALPLLQYALTELYEQRDGQRLTRAAYQSIGGVLGALGRRAEAVYAGLAAGEQAAARQLFLRLVTLGEGAEDTRRRALRSEVESVESALGKVLEVFGQARLLAFDRDLATRGPTVEVAHEALLREWPRLREWLTDSRGEVRLQRQLLQAAHDWEQAGREASFLLRGARLEQFAEWAKGTSLALTPFEQAYLRASLDEHARQRQLESERQAREVRLERRARGILQALVGVFLAAALAAGGLAWWANGQRREADAQRIVAQARELAAAANSNLTVDPERSILLALQAVDRTYTLDHTALPEAAEALHWALQSSHIERTLNPNLGAALAVAISPDGSRLATVHIDGTTLVWDAHTGDVLLTFAGDERLEVNSYGASHLIAFSPDGRWLATTAARRLVNVWDLASGQKFRTFPFGGSIVYTLAFSPDSRQIAIGGYVGATAIWDIATGEFSHTLGCSWICDKIVAFSPDGTRIASTDWRNFLLWDAASGRPLTVTFDSLDSGSANVAFSPDGARLAGTGWDMMGVWDAHSGKLLRTWSFKGEANAYDILFSPDGKRLATTYSDGAVKLWDAATGAMLLALNGHTGAATGVAFSPDGHRLVTCSADGTTRVWDLNPGREALTLAHDGRVTQAVFSPDGRRLATSGGDSAARLWDAQTGQPLFALTLTAGAGVAFSPDGTQIAVSTVRDDFGVTTRSAATGAQLLFLDVGGLGYGIPVFSPDGSKVAASYGGDAAGVGATLVWDARTGRRLLTLSGHEGYGTNAAFSPDGTRLITGGSDRVAKIFDARTGQELLSLVGHTDAVLVSPAAFSPDGRRVATASSDGTARVWDAFTGELLLTLSRHTAGVASAAFSPDGKFLATASSDQTAKIWDAQTGQELLILRGHTGPVNSVAFSPDGQRLVTASNDGTARVFLLQLEELLALARTRVTRGLTDVERETYLHVVLPPPTAAPSTLHVVLSTPTATPSTAPGAVSTATSAPDISQPVRIVNLPGTFQTQLGCQEDWAPACPITFLAFDPSSGLWRGAFALATGYYEYKVSLNYGWGENYGLGAVRDGPNIPLSITTPTSVTFLYDPATHWVADSVNQTLATLSGDFQTALGCPSNWQTDCLAAWLQDPDGDGRYLFTTDQIPAGKYAAQVVRPSAAGAPAGDRLAFHVEQAGQAIQFSYDAATGALTIGPAGP